MLDLTDIKALPSRSLQSRGQTDQKWASMTKCHKCMTEVAQVFWWLGHIAVHLPVSFLSHLLVLLFSLYYITVLGLTIISLCLVV